MINKIEPNILINMYREMLKIRLFEDKVYYLFLQGILPGTIHQCQGQEAVAVGVCSALKESDFICSTHRSHGHSLAKGMSVYLVIAELFGRKTGCCKGKGGSMHLSLREKGIAPATAVLGESILMATGIGLAFRMQNTDRVAVGFFGDGTSNIGAFHEGLNMGAIWDLPVIYICENNQYAASTPIKSMLKIDNISSRASSYGIPGITIDGMNVIEVFKTTKKAVERAREGKGPTLIECITYRFVGHSRSDPTKYRSKEEVEFWKSRDPIRRLRDDLKKLNLIKEEEFLKIENELVIEIDQAFEKALKDPLPELEEALEDVYA